MTQGPNRLRPHPPSVEARHAECFDPYRPDGWSVDRALANLNDKLAVADFTNDLNQLVRSGPKRLRHRRCSGDTTDAIGLHHDDFDDHPSLSTLQRLVDAVDGDRDRCLDDAIEIVRQRVSKPGPGKAPVRNDVLVDIVMWARRYDDAWAAARTGGCNSRQRMALAATREASHPVDAIDVYEPEVIRSIEAKNNQGYAAAIELMTRIHRLAESAGAPERFNTLLGIARTAHKPKRNLQKLLDQQGW